jgi:MraZ protein
MEDRNARKLKTLYSANSQVCTLDKQGRVNLMKSLIDHAGIQKETVTIGAIDHIAIWSKERYDAEVNPLTTDVSDLFDSMQKYIA